MSGRKQSQSRGWGILYSLGLFFVLFGGVKVIQNIKIPVNFQPYIALASAALWFVSALIFQKLPDKTQKAKASQFFSLVIGLFQIIFAVLCWTVDEAKIQIFKQLKFYNLGLCVFSISVLYAALFQFFFPALQPTTPKPRPDPLEEFPATTQEVVKKGAYWVNLPTILTICAFFVIGVIGMAITTAKSHEEALDFFLIVTGAGFLIAFVIGIIQTYRWQKWALQSGIPEAELKAAAKCVGLWWPKTKEE